MKTILLLAKNITIARHLIGRVVLDRMIMTINITIAGAFNITILIVTINIAIIGAFNIAILIVTIISMIAVNVSVTIAFFTTAANYFYNSPPRLFPAIFFPSPAVPFSFTNSFHLIFDSTAESFYHFNL